MRSCPPCDHACAEGDDCPSRAADDCCKYSLHLWRDQPDPMERGSVRLTAVFCVVVVLVAWSEHWMPWLMELLF